MNSSVRNKLSVMMFLEFFIWGAWLPKTFGYLNALQFDEMQQFWILSAFNIGALTAMFFSTQFVDRNFAAEKFLAFSHLVGGLAILALGFVTDFWPFFLLMLVHSLFYVPTISITNSIAFANLPDAQHDFPLVRLWGTIGWIAASVPFVFILTDWARVPGFGTVPLVDWLGSVLGKPLGGPEGMQATRFIYIVAGIASLLLAGFSLSLPHTPPKPAAAGQEALAWLKAMKLLRYPFIAVLFLVTFIDAAVHQGYFVLTEVFLQERVGIALNWTMPVMTIGQIAEIATMAFLGICLKKLGWRATMVIGILGHTARFAVFAYFPEPWPAITVNVLHGICYAFFFATVYIFVDEFFPKDARSSAQGLFNFLILGLGPIVANFVWPYLKTYYTTGRTVDYQALFLVPSATALVAALLLLIFFHPPLQTTTAHHSVP